MSLVEMHIKNILPIVLFILRYIILQNASACKPNQTELDGIMHSPLSKEQAQERKLLEPPGLIFYQPGPHPSISVQM